jgi:hypothetical protein
VIEELANLIFEFFFPKKVKVRKSSTYNGPSVWTQHKLFPGNSQDQFLAFMKKKQESGGTNESVIFTRTEFELVNDYIQWVRCN